MLIDVGTGRWSIFTIGHRNPQGLTVDLQGRIWSTEHGPRGGDELNLLRKGHDYGYPMHTYGTEYGSTVWPGADEAVKDPALTRPVYAWVPSIGPSDLIVVSDPAFHRWRGDLLVASLRGMAIWRVRLDGEHVAYAEPIPIGRRIRDIAAGKGEFLLLTDSDEFVRIRSDDHADEGGLIFMLRCGGCHDNLDHRIGPNLLGIMNHQIASRKGYQYSTALKHVRGSWTAERLDQFLKDPQAFAPGTAMTIDGVQDPVERRRIIDYIRYFYED